jgi:D-beta-D-heptose 7-phosphate kinase/D-beta-D-heptose 1-phosphate adenosyltransferase
MKIVAVSMGADPVHIGHIRNIQEAKLMGDILIVILNNDNWLKKKKGYVFMPENERAEIMRAFRSVDGVIITKHSPNDENMTVSRELEMIRPSVFCKGGDRVESNMPKEELDICKKLGIKILYNIGGKKIQSSSELVKRLKNASKS